jgi:hypothetical protein
MEAAPFPQSVSCPQGLALALRMREAREQHKIVASS